jgi:hypothetical protein
MDPLHPLPPGSEDKSDYRHMSLGRLAKQVSDEDNIVIVCGAGLSSGVAPLAEDVEHGLLAAVEYLADESPSDPARKVEYAEVKKEYFTLELFVSALRHRVPDLERPLLQLYQHLFHLTNINRANRAVASALGSFAKSGKRAVVLTANFDDGLTTSLQDERVKYRLVTRNNVQKALLGHDDTLIDICAYHGTIQHHAPDHTKPSGPTSMTARNLAHPFPPGLSQYVQQTLAKAGSVLFIGHKGEDFYDLNMELRRNLQQGVTKKDRFICLPHEGKIENVSASYEKLFGKEGLVLIKELEKGDWIGDLFDAISGKKTPSPGILPPAAGVDQVNSLLIAFVDKHYHIGSEKRWMIGNQCAALLDDIKAGAFAAWSVIEHYRLESIGYSQEEIAAFGRAAEDSKYHSIPVAELIQLQRDYQSFRNNFAKLNVETISDKDRRLVIEAGLKLADRLEGFASQAREALPVASYGTQKAIARLLAAIPYDYCGLLGMRLMQIIHVPPIPKVPAKSDADLEKLLDDIDASSMRRLAAGANDEGQGGNGIGLRTELLFKISTALAKEAGKDLVRESRKFSSDVHVQQAYADNLSQIVGWQDWELAPTENRFRLSFVPVEERLEGYMKMINIRMNRMKKEEAVAGHPEEELSFSASADAAQCAVRVCEVARLLAGVSGRGTITKNSMILQRTDAKEILSKIPEMARRCMEVAEKSSSVKNWLIMQAYDALLLESLLNERGNAKQIMEEAKEYAKDTVDVQFSTRLEDMRSRFA